MISFFVRPWEIYETGETVEIQGKQKTLQEVRQNLYENIIDEVLFIARASEGAVSTEWMMNQPIFIRKKYLELFREEMKEREKSLAAKKQTKKQK